MILMLQRCDDLFPGHWNLPGGHALPGEDALSATIRELREETGLAAAPAALEFAGVSHIRPPGRSEKISFTFLCRQWSGSAEVREPAKFSSLIWTPIAHLPRPTMPQAGEALRMLRSGQRFSTYGLSGPTPLLGQSTH
jgi:8-oxo-dGTP pyrophosphatase MutT (NUDIX family)